MPETGDGINQPRGSDAGTLPASRLRKHRQNDTSQTGSVDSIGRAQGCACSTSNIISMSNEIYVKQATEHFASIAKKMGTTPAKFVSAMGEQLFQSNVNALAAQLEANAIQAQRELSVQLVASITLPSDLTTYAGLTEHFVVTVDANGIGSVALVEAKKSRASGNARISVRDHAIAGTTYDTWRAACVGNGLTEAYFDAESRSGHREYRKLVESGKAPMPDGLAIVPQVADYFVKLVTDDGSDEDETAG